MYGAENKIEYIYGNSIITRMWIVMFTNKNYEKALRVNLDKNLAEELEKIKSYYGIKADSDCIRFLIKEKSREIKSKK